MAIHTSERSDLVYAEVHAFPLWVYLTEGLACLAALVAIVVGAAVSNTAAWVLGIVFFIVIGLAGLALSHLEFVITGDHVRFGFATFQTRFPRSAVRSCEPFEVTSDNYYPALGVKYGRDGTLAYAHRNGPGVKITFDGARWPYVVSVDDPEKVCEILSAD